MSPLPQPDDLAYSEATVKQLIDANAPISDEDWLTYLFVADAATMTDVERPLLAVDLSREPAPSACRPAGTRTSQPTSP
ncbi:hypothetical protein PSH03_003328 [Micromonospora sp. PSH03]|uniref:DUF6924 domain-containing protein n=1 Tax=Micromonospora salmantinae TaxID=2911211 RepID=UPI001EE7EA6F|nr:hypothetical protein [Micromonospora salmantinae]MCG5458156.1 hypothetical protein [Micromonospora salmantinae]